jgi:dihydrodipicolinate synthase/N-acetylneuraminate lyase
MDGITLKISRVVNRKLVYYDMAMSTGKPYRGVVVPMVTPLARGGSVDPIAAARITDRLVTAGASVFVLGTTGEAPSIAPAERAKLVDATVRANVGRALIYAGISDNSAAVSIDLARRFADLGAQVAVAHVPCFYPLDDESILRYFESLAGKVPIPLMLYNMPSLCKVSLPLSVLDQLSHHPNIVGLKDSANDTQRLAEAVALWKDRPDFAHLTGCAALSLAGLSQGSDGIVPSAGNLAPGLFCELYESVRNGDLDLAEKLQARADCLGQMYAKGR